MCTQQQQTNWNHWAKHSSASERQKRRLFHFLHLSYFFHLINSPLSTFIISSISSSCNFASVCLLCV
jgi:hypothetical protein